MEGFKIVKENVKIDKQGLENMRTGERHARIVP